MKNSNVIIGAAFLMATSAIGPGFLTQTSLFTEQLLSSFGFVILISVLLDIAAQLNIWSIISATGKYAQQLANEKWKGLGVFLAALISFGGLVFNIGNIGGTGLGAHMLTGVDTEIGAVISAIVAIAIFWVKEIGKLVDWIVKVLGIIMIGLTLYIAITSAPPLTEALYRTLIPKKVNFLTIVTIVGGTVGGYISFSGAHRLLQAGMVGRPYKKEVTRSAVSGILVTSLMRYILFLAALGVVSAGVSLNGANPAASVFESAAGRLGHYFFGMVLWIAAITSVIGASYTTLTFWKTLSPVIENNEKGWVTLFIFVSTAVFLYNPKPVQLLVLAGAVNGLILPLALSVLLIAISGRPYAQEIRQPLVFKIIGWLVVLLMTFMGGKMMIDLVG